MDRDYTIEEQARMDAIKKKKEAASAQYNPTLDNLNHTRGSIRGESFGSTVGQGQDILGVKAGPVRFQPGIPTRNVLEARLQNLMDEASKLQRVLSVWTDDTNLVLTLFSDLRDLGYTV